MAPIKGKKMALGEFITSFGDSSVDNWAEDDFDLETFSTALPVPDANKFTFNKSSSSRPGADSLGSRSVIEREVYPIPDAPPYNAKVNNLAWDLNVDRFKEFVEDALGADSIVNFNVPEDEINGRLRGSAFIEVKTAAQLERFLSMSGSNYEGRKFFVAVAAPRRQQEEFDWSVRRGPIVSTGAETSRYGNREERGPREPREPRNEDFDWGARRGPITADSDRRGADRADRAPRDEDLDWSARRGPITRDEKRGAARDEDFDWSARRGPIVAENGPARGSRREAEAEMDWSAKKGPVVGGPRRAEPEVDWSVRKGPIVDGPATAAAPPRKRGWGGLRSRAEIEATAGDKKSESSAKPAAGKPAYNPFGAAKPVDVTEHEKLIEEKLSKQREQLEETAAALKEKKSGNSRKSSLTKSSEGSWRRHSEAKDGKFGKEAKNGKDENKSSQKKSSIAGLTPKFDVLTVADDEEEPEKVEETAKKAEEPTTLEKLAAATVAEDDDSSWTTVTKPKKK